MSSSAESDLARQAERLGSEKDIEQVVREHERVQRHLETLGTEIRQVETEAVETTALLSRLERVLLRWR